MVLAVPQRANSYSFIDGSIGATIGYGSKHSTRGGDMADETPDPDNARSPAPDAAPEDNPAPDALKDADIKSGTGDPEMAYPEQEGESGPAAGTSPQEAGSA
jgi:hypothetical protein